MMWNRWAMLLGMTCVIIANDVHAALVVSEMMVHPDFHPDPQHEWFELYNSGTSAVDLSTIRFDDKADASGGSLLSGTLNSGQYAVVGRYDLANWLTHYGQIAPSALYVDLTGSNWPILANQSGLITLYDVTTSQNIFTMTYGSEGDSPTGTTIEFQGTNAALVSPYAFSTGNWQHATDSHGGTLGGFHTAGYGPLQVTATPEPASLALLTMAGLGLTTVVRRNRRKQIRSGTA